MRLVCAWCGNTLKTTRTGCKGAISYGICLPCANSVLNGTPGLMKEYIDRIDCPVALVNGDGVVMTANTLACALLDKDLKQLEGAACGDIFGCVNAGNPAGCGNVTDCAGCEIRRCVTHTHRTGKGFSEIPAHVRQGPQAAGDIWWLISTSKFMDCVVLRIAGAARVKKTKIKKEEEGEQEGSLQPEGYHPRACVA